MMQLHGLLIIPLCNHWWRTPPPPAKCALLPLFDEKSATPATIKHDMNVLRLDNEFLNGQIPVSTFDHPLFGVAKLK